MNKIAGPPEPVVTDLSEKSAFSRGLAAISSYGPAVVFLMAVGVRMMALFAWNNSLYSGFLFPEERIYHEWASAIASGSSASSVVYGVAPLYAGIMALFYKVLSVNIDYIRMLNIFFGTAACVLVCIIGRNLAGKTAGLLAGLAAGLYKPFIFFSVVPTETALSLFLFALAGALFISVVNSAHPTAGRASWFKVFLLGCLAGLLLNIEIHYILMIPVLLVAVLMFHLRKGTFYTTALRMMMFAAGAAASIVPFVTGNFPGTDILAAPVCGGFDFYMGFRLDNPSPYCRPVPFASSPSHEAHAFVIEASRRAGRRLSFNEASGYWISETLRQASENRRGFISKTGFKVWAFFNRCEASGAYPVDFISDTIDFFRWPFFETWMLLPLGMAGTVLTVTDSRGYRAVFLLAAAYAVTLIIFFTNTDARLPLMILLIPMAVVGVKHFLESMASGSAKTAVLYSAMLLLFFTAACLPIDGTGDLSGAYNIHAANLYTKGRSAEAVRYWELSSRMNGAYSPFAELSLAEYHFRRGNAAAALRRLERIPVSSPAAARKYAMAGEILLRQKKVRAAVRAYEASLAVDAGQKDLIAKLTGIYRRLDVEAAMRTQEKEAYIASFYRMK